MSRYDAALLAVGRRIVPGDRASKLSFNRALSIAALVACLVTAASFLARGSWLLELFTHFRFQLALGSLMLLLCALARRRLLTAALAALAAAANAAPLVPYIFPAPLAAQAAGDSFRLMSANVHYRNTDYSALLAEVRRQDPDVLGLMEVDGAWLDGLSALESQYRYRVLRPEEGAYGLALYSKLPIRRLPTSPYIERGFQTAVLVELETGEGPVTLALAHVRAPTGPAKARLRNAQFGKIAEMLELDGSEARILIGDLNTTPWSPYYRQLAETTGMQSAALGYGYEPSWPSGFSLLKIPIDHCLVSEGLRVASFQTGADVGSDHLPIVIDVTMARTAADSNAAR